MLSSFKLYYPNTNIAYSYKTNYIPRFCKIVNEHGGFAEVVSDMELQIALNSGVQHKHIFFNGPYKSKEAMEKLLLGGGADGRARLAVRRVHPLVVDEQTEHSAARSNRAQVRAWDAATKRMESCLLFSSSQRSTPVCSSGAGP